MSTPITPQAVKQLRERTDLPMGDCKNALVEANGDMEKAIEVLRSKFAKMTAKREGNETAEGRVGIYYDNAAKIAGIVEMRCETAPSAKSDQYIALTNELAKHVATNKATDVPGMLAETFQGSATVNDRINDTVGVIREKMILHKFKRSSGGVYGGYVHHDGTVGVLIECQGTPNDEVIRDVAAHVAALNPPYTTVADVPADVVEKEKSLVMADIQADSKNTGKPANILEKIAEGKLRTKLAEMVLTEQPMANAMKYPNTTVGAALKKAGLEPVKATRYKVGAVTLG